MDPEEKIKSLSPKDFSEICRICLCSEDLQLIPETLVENIEATDLFRYTMGIQFDKNDLMPDNICNNCLVTLYEIYKVKEQCLINELLFKTQINKYKTLQNVELSREKEKEDVTVKREKEIGEGTIPLNGNIVNIVTTISDQVLVLNDVKVEPNDYDLILEDEKENKPEEGPKVTKTVKTENTIGTGKAAQPIVNLLNNGKNTQPFTMLTSDGMPICTKEPTTSDEVLELNDIKVEPDFYDLTLKEEKENKPKEGPKVIKTLTTENTIRPDKTEQSIVNLWNNGKNTQPFTILTLDGIPICTKETTTTSDEVLGLNDIKVVPNYCDLTLEPEKDNKPEKGLKVTKTLTTENTIRPDKTGQPIVNLWNNGKNTQPFTILTLDGMPICTKETTTSDEVLELNDIKVEPDFYDLTLEEEKENKLEERPKVTKTLTTENTVRPGRTEQPILNLFNNGKNTQPSIILTSVGIPNCTKETRNIIDTRTTFPMTAPIMYNPIMGTNTSNVVKPVYIVNYQQMPTNNLPIVPGAKGPATRQVYLLNFKNPTMPTSCPTKPASVTPTSFNLLLSGLGKPPTKENTKVSSSVPKTVVNGREVSAHLKTEETTTTSNIPPPKPKKKRCLKCRKCCASASILKRHKAKCKKDKEESKPFVCKVCLQIFANRAAFRRHLQQHLARKETDKQNIIEYFKGCSFSCDLCFLSFETEESLKNHRRNSHSGVLFLCSFCGKNLTSKPSLEYHIKTHTGEKPFSCKVCQKTFIHSGGLRRHMARHTDERTFKCNLCPKTFKTNLDLNRHLERHSGIKPYKCNFCDKKFAKPTHLRKHISTHTGEKRHFCPICNTGFYDKNIMRYHEKGCRRKRKNLDVQEDI